MDRRKFLVSSMATSAVCAFSNPRSDAVAEAVRQPVAASGELPPELREKLMHDPFRPQFHLLPRANWMDDSAPIVEPAIPRFLGVLDTKGVRASRLDLANWLISRDNPLTARVIVNRYEDIHEEVAPLDFVCSRAVGEFAPFLQWAGSESVAAKRVILWIGARDLETIQKIEGWEWHEPISVPHSLRRLLLVGQRTVEKSA